MTPWKHEPEFRQLMRQCLEGHGISTSDFDRLVAISHDAPQGAHAELEGLIRLMAQDAFPHDA